MKKDLLALASLMALVLGVGRAPAQTPPPCPPAGAPVSCEPCVPMKKICVPVEEKKKKTHTDYSTKTFDKCYPRFSGFSLFRCKSKTCDPCQECGECTRCGKPREYKKLVKRFRTEEECHTKYEAVSVPACEPCPPCVPDCPPPCEGVLPALPVTQPMPPGK